MGRVGVEIHATTPHILQFYNLVGDRAIARIQSKSKPHLMRARVLGTPENKDIKSDIRTSSVTWLNERGTGDPSLQYAYIYEFMFCAVRRISI